MAIDYKDIGQRVKEKRIQKGLTQERRRAGAGSRAAHRLLPGEVT